MAAAGLWAPSRTKGVAPHHFQAAGQVTCASRGTWPLHRRHVWPASSSAAARAVPHWPPGAPRKGIKVFKERWNHGKRNAALRGDALPPVEAAFSVNPAARLLPGRDPVRGAEGAAALLQDGEHCRVRGGGHQGTAGLMIRAFRGNGEIVSPRTV